MRTDIHRPSAINPEDYTYVGCEHIKIEGMGDVYVQMEMRRVIQEHMARTGGRYSDHEHGGNCMVCGSVNAIYTILFHHPLTNTYVRMGQDCAQKTECAFDNSAFNRFKDAVDGARHAVAGKKKAQAILAANGLTPAWDLYLEERKPCLCGQVNPNAVRCTCKDRFFKFEERTLCDMVHKLTVYGDFSDKQITFAQKLLVQIDQRAAIEAQRAAEKAAASPVPSGRVVIEGVVLTTKIQESDFGNTWKMLVKADAGWTVWGTIPSALSVNKNDRVKFKATIEPSDKDPKHGFYSRPTV